MDFLNSLNNKPSTAKVVEHQTKLDKTRTRTDGQIKSTNKATKHLFQGKNARQWAEELQVSPLTVKKRFIAYGYPFNRTYCAEQGWLELQRRGRKSSKFEGKTMLEWSKQLKIHVDTCRKNLRKYGHPYSKRHAKILNKTLQSKWHGKTVEQWAKYLDMRSATVEEHLKTYGHLYNMQKIKFLLNCFNLDNQKRLTLGRKDV